MSKSKKNEAETENKEVLPIVAETPEIIAETQPETEQVEAIAEMPAQTPFIFVKTTNKGIFVANATEPAEAINLKNFPKGTILVFEQEAFITPEGAAQFLANKLTENPTFSILGIAPNKPNALLYAKTTGIAHYPAISGACVAVVSSEQDITLNYKNVAAFFRNIAVSRAPRTQAGYIKMENKGYFENPAAIINSAAPCPTC